MRSAYCLCLSRGSQETAWKGEHADVQPDWPAEGAVEFRQYALRYREGLDLVLRGIDVKTRGGEKVARAVH